MKQRLAAFIITALVAEQSFACPKPFQELLVHKCWCTARAELHLLPEELPLLEMTAGGHRRQLSSLPETACELRSYMVSPVKSSEHV